jgi:hypothetical protein
MHRKIKSTNGFRALVALDKAAQDLRVDEIEGDGMDEGRIFIHARRGYWFGPLEMTHSRSAGNAAELKRALELIEPCECEQCKAPRIARKPELCGACGSPMPADRSCDCFDNHCQ